MSQANYLDGLNFHVDITINKKKKSLDILNDNKNLFQFNEWQNEHWKYFKGNEREQICSGKGR